MKKKSSIFIIFLVTFIFSYNANASSIGIVNVNDSLTLRSEPTTNSSIITKFYNNTTLEILDTNAGKGNGCDDNWYKVKYSSHTGYSCSTFINTITNSTSSNGTDESYSKDNYNNPLSKDGSIMCYEDTDSITLRSTANGTKLSGKMVECGEEVNIVDVTETAGAVCPYWYKVDNGSNSGYVCSYYVNTTKLSNTAENYYKNNTNGDTIASYKAKLINLGFPKSYHSYLLELHARKPNWNFVAEQINLTFDEVVVGESAFGRNLLQGSSFDQGYLSTASSTYNATSNKFNEYIGEIGWYQASNEAIAYYLDPRNYLNERYIFAFETLEFRDNQSSSIVENFFKGKTLFNTPYSYYKNQTKGSNGLYSDGSTGKYNEDIVKASQNANVSAIHISSRILQEVGSSGSASSRGGSFNYCGSTYSGYYNFFNIKATATSCSSAIASGLKYAKDNGWNTPYKSILAGSSLLSNSYIKINQDTIYYEKFDISTNNGHYTHQYQQNLTAPIAEGGVTYTSYVNNLANYLKSNISFVIPVFKDMPTYAVTAPKLGNPNNYLNKLTVDGKSVANFSYDIYNYNISLSSSTTTVNIGATAMQGTSKITGLGTTKITNNEQDVIINVKAQNGKYRNYTIHFIKKDTKPTTVVDSLNNSGFKYNDKYLFGINVGTNVSELIGNIRDYNDLTAVEVRSSTGQVKTNDSFRTGDKVSITASGETKDYEVVIYGDVDGDGEISKQDLLQVQRDVFGYSSLNGIYKSAGDIDKNGVIDKSDLLQVQRDVFGYGSIKQ